MVPEARIPFLGVNPYLQLSRFLWDSWKGKVSAGKRKMTSCLEHELFPVACDAHKSVCLCRQRSREPAAAPSSRDSTSPELTPALPQGTRNELRAGIPDKDQAPLLTDIISFDGQRLGLFFQLELLEDSGRDSIWLNSTDPGLIELVDVEGMRRALMGGNLG